ncbi:hypothetical protein R69927_06419 [Paraburkholderia domus]|jgi:hypothetical protein|uniref:DUF2474 domain-containing protein n=1 Tax=Paraburkholderia domus TaxID=2793075 RepID=A0A9N8R4R8_9BURK|nr:hypothetical protein [Paraburkholderia domus]MBK5053393.1 hypothetical protein [Burkholderia sp. R-70006]MBK5065251.1 hypothetical protein [Burkholderia sp. R-70199]MBK5090445.1 hypothetical protein [Burkholderia sp. R-69927]MBK5125248.1 hypothetical protein [Burkholderia sp. R-69980]MBK5169291.1 hypothetical protein [Burkholderia sp. R-70211]MBK5184556.1 hypothetical protein [Burkholderia sp. R-69749]MCI0150884.1 hypothetical protein [Paraburkholderia sediminicola]
MATNITITKDTGANAARSESQTPVRKLPGWLWFIALWCFGVASAVSLGFAFKLLMNATLFAVK